VGDRIGVALLFIVVVGAHRGNYVVAEAGTEILDMADGHHHREAEENGDRAVSPNFREMKSRRRPSLAKKTQGEWQDPGELTGTGIPEGHPGEDVSQCCSVTYSETSIYRSRIIRFPGSVQFLWSLSESYFNYGSRIYCFPGSIVSFSDPRRKR
jgi:hypothetical protein